MLKGWLSRLEQALGVALVPPKTSTEVKPINRPGNLPSRHFEATQTTKALPIPENLPRLQPTPTGMQRKSRRQHQIPRPGDQKIVGRNHGEHCSECAET